ncbi:MAG: radical SAM protein [Candidatus Omnitrophica bacterium]|nr:radical SAM protein [Candidatus Omnitrophota bacterium]MCK5083596.1 radical SAM protein [Candidatus Omnitrophota bacterium]
MTETIKERKKEVMQGKFVVDPPFPKEIFLDLTSFCNHKCVFCSNSQLKNKATMEPDMVERFLQEAYDCGVRDLGMYATGESFLVKDLAAYIKRAKTIGYNYLFITTNGALATSERVKPVLDAGLDSIKFSISAGRRETYANIQGKDDFDQVLENLKWVSEYRKTAALSFRIYVTMVYTDTTEEEVEILRDLVIDYIDEWDPHPLNNQCGNKFDNNELGKIESDNPRGRGQRKICFQPFKGFSITPEGLVSACVLDYSKDLIVADLNKTTLKEAWTNEVYKEFRQRHLDQNLKGLICYNCMHNADEPVDPLMPEYSNHFKEKK